MSSENPKRHAVAEVDRAVLLFVAVARVEGSDRCAFVEDFLQARLALVLGVLVGLIEPEGGAREIWNDVAKPEFTHARLAALNGCDDGNQVDGWIGQSLEWFAQPGGVV